MSVCYPPSASVPNERFLMWLQAVSSTSQVPPMMLENGSANLWRENSIPLFASAFRWTVTCLQCHVTLSCGCQVAVIRPVTSEFFECSFGGVRLSAALDGWGKNNAIRD